MIKKIKDNYLLILPLILVFLIFFLFLYFLTLNKDPSKPPSALLNKNLPKFMIKNLYNDNIYLSSDNIKKNVNISSDDNVYISEDNFENKYTIINFFASWCMPCKGEHPHLIYLKEKFPEVFIIGINHKDEKDDAINFLENEGNPYHFIGVDKDGAIALEFGVFGLPETFIINYEGKIIYKYIGPIDKKIVKNEIIPLFK